MRCFSPGLAGYTTPGVSPSRPISSTSLSFCCWLPISFLVLSPVPQVLRPVLSLFFFGLEPHQPLKTLIYLVHFCFCRVTKCRYLLAGERVPAELMLKKGLQGGEGQPVSLELHQALKQTLLHKEASCQCLGLTALWRAVLWLDLF